MTASWHRWTSKLGQHLLAFLLTLATLFFGALIATSTSFPTPVTHVAKLELNTLELTLAPQESLTPTQAALPDAPPPSPQPQPSEVPLLTEATNDFTLFQPPPLETPPPLERPALETLTPPPLTPHSLKTHLPEITLPPLQPLPQKAPTPQEAKGQTAQIKRPARLLTDPATLQKRYPPTALKRRWEGDVVLQLDINGEGELEALSIHRSSGYRVLDQEALRMMRKAQFTGGPDRLLQTIRFRIPQ